MELNFCRRCGTRLTRNGEPYMCENGHKLYAAAAPTVGVFFINDNKEVLLSVRGIEPGKGMLDTPGGFIDVGESIEQALVRELEEELALTPDDYEPFEYLCSGTTDYFFDNEHRPVLSSIFVSKLKPGVTPQALDDVEAVKFVSLADVNLDEISGDDIKAAIQILQQKYL